MGITTIYADEEANEILKQIKKKSPKFNLSAFVKTCLIEKGGKSSSLDEPTILKNKKDAELKIQNAENEVQYWDNVHKDFKVQQELKKQEQAEQESLLERTKRIKEEARMNVISTFSEETGKDMTPEMYEEFRGGLERKEWRHIWGYIDHLGLNKDDAEGIL